MAISGAAAHFDFRDPDGHVMEIYYEEQKFVPPETSALDAQEFAAEIYWPRRLRAPG